MSLYVSINPMLLRKVPGAGLLHWTTRYYKPLTAVRSCSEMKTTAAVFREKTFKGHSAAWIRRPMETQSGCENSSFQC